MDVVTERAHRQGLDADGQINPVTRIFSLPAVASGGLLSNFRSDVYSNGKIDLENALLHVRRVKEGSPATHPLTGNEPYCGSSGSRPGNRRSCS